MPTDDEAERERRAEMNLDWAQVRAKARAPAAARATSVYQSQTRKQIADRAQRAAGEALAALHRQRSEDR